MQTGYYIFNPILLQYRDDTRGTFNPDKISNQTTSSTSSSSSSSAESGASPTLATPILAQDEKARRAEELRVKATMNAATRAKEGALMRAEKTGEGRIV